jgi:hypothetical protein
MNLTIADESLRARILDDTFPIWNEGLSRDAYGRWNEAQLRTEWGRSHLHRFALLDGSGGVKTAPMPHIVLARPCRRTSNR